MRSGFLGRVRLNARERAGIAEVEVHLARRYAEFGIDPKRFGWTVRVRNPADRPPCRYVELLIPLHPTDGRLAESGGKRIPIWPDPMETCLRDVDVEIEFLHRHCDRERRLVEAGHDPMRPPASTFTTDLISRRAFAYRGVDFEQLVARGSLAFSAPSMQSDRGYIHRSSPARVPGWSVVQKPALPTNFYECAADFDLDRLDVWVLRLSDMVIIRPDKTDGGGHAQIDVHAVWPETVLIAIVGRRLVDVVDHPVFDDDRIVIVDAWEDWGWITLRVVDPIVPLA